MSSGAFYMEDCRPTVSSAKNYLGRCLTGVDSRSKWAPEFVAIDEQPYDEIVHTLRLGEAQRTTHEPFDPGPQVDRLALDLLRVLLAHLMLLGIEMPLVSPPPIGIKLRD